MTFKHLLTLSITAALTGCHFSTSQERTHTARRTEANALIAQTLPTTDPSPALVLSTADRATSATVDTINAIRAARNLILTDLRNADTTAYKSTLTSIPSAGTPTLQLDLTQGPLESTGRQLDLAIEGPGFFKIKLPNSPNGLAYTCNGNFFIDNQYHLILALGEGYPLLPPVTFPPGTTNVTISRDGTIDCTRPGQTTPTRIAQIQLALFPNPQSLSPLAAAAIYLPTPAAGPPTDSTPAQPATGSLLQGFLESSNTDLLRSRLRLQFLQQWEYSLLPTLEHPPK